MHPKFLSIKDFRYELPESRIASHPLPGRDESRLLVYREGGISEDIYRNITRYLPPHSFLVFNNTRVMEARILFRKPTGGTIEIFCLGPADESRPIGQEIEKQGEVHWQCLIGGASKWKAGQVLEKEFVANGKPGRLEARLVEKKSDHFIVAFSWSPQSLSFSGLLQEAGTIPLPPYLRREAEAEDSIRYQTIYAAQRGSVAAPTAGLHFTPELMASLAEKEISTLSLTLHVGAGTFLPVKSETMEGHSMHTEFIDISRDAIRAIRDAGNHSIIPVGTTSLRSLESLYWLACKIIRQADLDPLALFLDQWEPYEWEEILPSPKEALDNLLRWMDARQVDRLIARTRLLIAPGYRMKIASALVTNFHQPESTLLLLVAALIGPDWKEVYRYALDHDFRFLSYGDGCLLLPKKA